MVTLAIIKKRSTLSCLISQWYRHVIKDDKLIDTSYSSGIGWVLEYGWDYWNLELNFNYFFGVKPSSFCLSWFWWLCEYIIAITLCPKTRFKQVVKDIAKAFRSESYHSSYLLTRDVVLVVYIYSVDTSLNTRAFVGLTFQISSPWQGIASFSQTECQENKVDERSHLICFLLVYCLACRVQKDPRDLSEPLFM